MLPEDVQPERKTYRGVSSFGILPIVEDAAAPGVSITPEAIEDYKKEFYYRIRYIFNNQNI